MITENVDGESERYGSACLGRRGAKSALFVPLVDGGKATGVISLQNIDREHAFSESDQQLLETLAGSLSVALENARLVHETRQRNAELALINSVQEALAGELDLQAIYDAVGDRIRESSTRRSSIIVVARRGDGLLHFPYIDRARRAASPDEPMRADRLPQARAGDARAAPDRREHAERGRAVRQPVVLSRRAGQVGRSSSRSSRAARRPA